MPYSRLASRAPPEPVHGRGQDSFVVLELRPGGDGQPLEDPAVSIPLRGQGDHGRSPVRDAATSGGTGCPTVPRYG